MNGLNQNQLGLEVIPASDAIECPPDDIGLTSCEADELNFQAGGVDSVGNDGLEWDVSPGSIDWQQVVLVLKQILQLQILLIMNMM